MPNGLFLQASAGSLNDILYISDDGDKAPGKRMLKDRRKNLRRTEFSHIQQYALSSGVQSHAVGRRLDHDHTFGCFFLLYSS